MKRILQIVGVMDRAGAETMLMNLYRHLNRENFQFDFLYFSNKTGDYDDEIRALGGKIYRIPESNPLKRIPKIKSLLRQNPQWKTIHSHILFANAFVLYAAYKAGVPRRIAHSHNTRDASKGKVLSAFYQRFSRKMQARYATDFVACGRAAAKFLFPSQNEVLLIPNAIDTAQFAETGQNKKDYLKEAYGLDPDTLIILQLGRLNRVKNHPFSFSVLRELQKNGVKFQFFIAGQGDKETPLKREVKDLGLTDRVTFMGIRTDVPALLAGSDLMLMPSLYEGFPVVLVEAQAAGTPALIADTISPEVDLDTGLIHFASLQDDPKTWAEKIRKLRHTPPKSTPPERLKKLKTAGYDISTNVQLLENLYDNKKQA